MYKMLSQQPPYMQDQMFEYCTLAKLTSKINHPSHEGNFSVSEISYVRGISFEKIREHFLMPAAYKICTRKLSNIYLNLEKNPCTYVIFLLYPFQMPQHFKTTY